MRGVSMFPGPARPASAFPGPPRNPILSEGPSTKMGPAESRSQTPKGIGLGGLPPGRRGVGEL